jgi:hypothetical protein
MTSMKKMDMVREGGMKNNEAVPTFVYFLVWQGKALTSPNQWRIFQGHSIRKNH